MAETNIKISGIGDVSRADFLRAITDTDKFREFADRLGWGNKRRLMAWDSLNNYAQGVKNGEINEINDMHLVVDDTGVRTNKKERYNWIGSKFDANGATAAFMNSVAKRMTTKKEDKTLKAVPTVSSYLNNLWFGSDTPDWALFLKNDVLTKDKYGITNRMAKLKAGLLSLKNILTTKGAEYNWDGVDKDKLFSNLDNAINSSNIAAYAPLGLTSDYLNSALATKDLSSTTVELPVENTSILNNNLQSSLEISGDLLLAMDSNMDLAELARVNPSKRDNYIAQARQRLANQITLSELQADTTTLAYANLVATLKQLLYNLEMLNWYKSLTINPEYTTLIGGSYIGTPGGGASAYLDSLNFSDEDFERNSPRTIAAIAASTTFKKPELRTVKTVNGSSSIKLNNKLDVLAYMLQFNAKNNPNFRKYFTDVSSPVNKPEGSIYRINALKDNNGAYVYVRKNGNNYEFYRSKPINILYKEYLAKKHKLGGIITRFLQGGAAAYNVKLKLILQEFQKVKLQLILNLPQTAPTGRASIKEMNKNTQTLTTADKIAIGAAAADFIASFTANPIANGAGTILTTGADLASDISHGASMGQAAGNAAMNLGMGLIGFIPGLGTATKAKKLKKILLFSSGAILSYFIANNFTEGVQSLGKVLNGSATVQDYKNLIYGLQGAKGISNSVINASKRRAASKVLNALPDKFSAGEARYTFKSKGKETERLTKAQVKELQEKGSEGVSKDILTLLHGVEIKPAKEGWFNINKKPLEYQYKSKEEILKVLNDLNILSQSSSMWNPGKLNYLSMASEHDWSLPSISLNFGKNSAKRVIERGKLLSKPNTSDSPIVESEPIPIVISPPEPTPLYFYTPRDVLPSFTPYITKGRNYSFESKPLSTPEPTPSNNPITSRNNKRGKKSKKKHKHLEGGILYDYNFLNSVYAFRKGGIIKANNGIKYNNIYAEDGEDYSYDNYLNKYFQNTRMLATMRNHYSTIEDYAKDVMNNVNSRFTNGINDYDNSTTYTANEGIRDFNRSYQGEDGSKTFNYTMFGGNANDYNNKTNGVAYDLIKGWVRPAKNMKTGDSYNIDSKLAYVDNAHGLQTYSRVMSLTNKDIKSGGFGEWGDSWKLLGATGAYYYIADGDTSGRGQWIPTTDATKKGYISFDATPTKEPKGSKTDPDGDIGKKSIFQKGKEYFSKLTSNPGNLYNAIETGKYLLANKTTNDLAKIKLPSYMLSPKHTSYLTKDDLSQWNAYTSASAASLNWAAKHPATSSGLLQAAQMYDAMNSANLNNIKGGIARNTHLDSEAEKTYKSGVYNMESSVDTANANAQLAWQVRKVNEYENPRARLIGLATNRQNWINALEQFNVINPYTERKNAMQQYGLAKAQWDYSNDAAVNLAYENYKKEMKDNENNSSYDASTSDAAKKYREALRLATARYYNNMYSIYGIKSPDFQTVSFSKKGGKFEDISKFNTKEFYNTVRHSINTALKLGTDLNKLLISKSTRK